MEPTSEQELKQLLDQDRISKTEYDQLLAAMHSKQRLNEHQNRPYGRQKKYKFLAFLSIIASLCFSAALVISIFGNKPALVVINGIAAILMGASAIRYWIRYLSYE